MPVIADTSELRTTSNLPHIPNAGESDVLEATSGADLMVTTLTLPAHSDTMVRYHAEHGALLMQRKTGLDLVHSVGDRLNDALARMHEVAPKQSQRILLFIGVLTCNHNGDAVIDGRNTTMSYWHVQGALDKWCDRGGVARYLSCSSLLPQWLEWQEKHLIEYRRDPTKLVLIPVDYPNDAPDVGDPLQLPKRVTDGRRVIAALDGVGPKRAQALYDTIKEHNERLRPGCDVPPDLNQLLFWATMSRVERERLHVKVPLWGEGTYKHVRDQFPLYEGSELAQDLRVFNSWTEVENDDR